MVLLAGLTTLLERHSGQQDVVVGSPIAGRTRRELEDLIGLFVNTLAFRRPGGDPPLGELLEQVRTTTLGAYAHQELPFEKLVAELAPERSLSHAPLFQVLLGLHNMPGETLELPGLTLSAVGQERSPAKFDLTLNLHEWQGRLEGRWLYDGDLFDVATVQRLTGHLRAVLGALAGMPESRLSELELLSPAERHQALEWNGAGWVPEAGLAACLHERFEAAAAADPTAIAAVCGEESWTYAELSENAHRLARQLDELGVRAGDRVGLFLDRSLDLVAAVLAVLETGAAYVPLDPAYPADRVAFVLADSGVKSVVSQRHLEVRLPGLPDGVEIVWVKREGELSARPRAEPLLGRAVPASPAYVIYTSGSTVSPRASR